MPSNALNRFAAAIARNWAPISTELVASCHQHRLSGSQRIATSAVLSAMALAVLDMGMVNVALPSLAKHFHARPSDIVLVVSAYQAALLVGLLPSAHLAGRFGGPRIFICGIGLFCGGTISCALAPSLPLLIVARFLQGLGGAAVMALGVALLREALGIHRLRSAIAWNALTVALCSAAGPMIGVAILSVAPWPWLFLAGLPLGGATLLASRALPHDRGGAQDVDTPSIAVLAAAVLLLVAAARLATTEPIFASGLATLAALLLLVLTRRSQRRPNPMLPLDLLARRPFARQAIASICCFIGQSIGLVALPFHLNNVLPNGLLATGMILSCWPAGVAGTSRVASRMKGKSDPAAQCAVGGVILGIGLLMLALLPISAGVLPLAACAALCGIGFGLFQLANNHILFLSAPSERAAAAGGVQGSARLIGQTTGTLIVGLIFALEPAALATVVGLAVAVAFALAAAFVAGSQNSRQEAPVSVAVEEGTAR